LDVPRGPLYLQGTSYSGRRTYIIKRGSLGGPGGPNNAVNLSGEWNFCGILSSGPVGNGGENKIFWRTRTTVWRTAQNKAEVEIDPETPA